jgi:hypothetical protein
VVGAVVEASSVGTIEELASVGTIEELASVMTVLDLKSLPTIFSPIAKAPATKNTHATIIDIGIMLLSKKSTPIPKRIAKEISTRYLTYFRTTNSLYSAFPNDFHTSVNYACSALKVFWNVPAIGPPSYRPLLPPPARAVKNFLCSAFKLLAAA